MSSSTSTALRRPTSLAELLDSRPDTREMISANLNLAHACLLAQRGDREGVERALELAQHAQTPGAISITACVRAELLRQAGRPSEAWEMAREQARLNRFDVVSSLYLRFLFTEYATVIASASGGQERSSASGAVAAPAAPAAAPVSVVPEAPSLSDSWVSLADLDEAKPEEASAPLSPPSNEPEPVLEGLSPAWNRVASEASVRLLRVTTQEGVQEVRRVEVDLPALEEGALHGPARLLGQLGFGRLLHAGFEGADAVVHTWTREDLSALLVCEAGITAPALAARGSHAIEENA